MDPPGGSDDEQAERMKKELVRELRRALTEELSASVRQQVEGEVRAATRREVLREVAARAPTTEQRDRAVWLIEHIELDALAQATVCSEIADEAEETLRRSRAIMTPLAYVVSVLLLPTVYAASLWLGSSSSAFVVAAATLALFTLMLLGGNARRHLRLERELRANRKTASDFMIIAERAKAYRMVHLPQLGSAEEVGELVEQLRLDKERQDRDHHPSNEALDRVRERVRQQVEPRGTPFRIAAPQSDDADEDESNADVDEDHEVSRRR